MLFREWLAEKLRERDLRIVQLSQDIGLSRETIWKHLHGYIFPFRTTFNFYCEYFGVPLEAREPMYYEFKLREADLK